MTRRDTIIITTLINAGLLACLFITATREEEFKPDPLAMSEAENFSQPPETFLPKDEVVSYITDDVDLALKEFLPQESSNTTLLEEEVIEVFKTEPVVKSEPVQESILPLQKTSDKIVEVKVKKGDMLEKIARANGTTVSAIKALNNLKNDKLAVGQTLKVPVGEKKPAEKPKIQEPLSQKESPDGQGPVFYKIQSGDNPWKIAKKFHVRFEDILRLNNMTEEKSKHLKVGQEIRVK